MTYMTSEGVAAATTALPIAMAPTGPMSQMGGGNSAAASAESTRTPSLEVDEDVSTTEESNKMTEKETFGVSVMGGN